MPEHEYFKILLTGDDTGKHIARLSAATKTF